MPFISATDGTSLFFREWGEGDPVLFLSSLGMSTRMWDYQIPALADAGLRCISLDRRGHGRSDEPAHGYDHDTLADDVATLINGLNLDRLILVGHSMACGEIVRYVTRHGAGRVARIVLIGTMTPRLIQDAGNPTGIPHAAFEALLSQWRDDYPHWVEESLAPFFVPETSRPMMRWAAGLLQTALPVAMACSRAMAGEDFRAEMRQIKVPCLVIHGDRDRSAPIEVTAGPSAALLPNCRYLVY